MSIRRARERDPNNYQSMAQPWKPRRVHDGTVPSSTAEPVLRGGHEDLAPTSCQRHPHPRVSLPPQPEESDEGGASDKQTPTSSMTTAEITCIARRWRSICNQNQARESKRLQPRETAIERLRRACRRTPSAAPTLRPWRAPSRPRRRRPCHPAPPP